MAIRNEDLIYDLRTDSYRSTCGRVMMTGDEFRNRELHGGRKGYMDEMAMTVTKEMEKRYYDEVGRSKYLHGTFTSGAATKEEPITYEDLLAAAKKLDTVGASHRSGKTMTAVLKERGALASDAIRYDPDLPFSRFDNEWSGPKSEPEPEPQIKRSEEWCSW